MSLFFFIEYHQEYETDTSLTQHKNEVKQINTIYLEADKTIEGFLKSIGIDKLSNQFSTSTGNIFITHKTNLHKSRIIAIDFLKTNDKIYKASF